MMKHEWYRSILMHGLFLVFAAHVLINLQFWSSPEFERVTLSLVLRNRLEVNMNVQINFKPNFLAATFSNKSNFIIKANSSDFDTFLAKMNTRRLGKKSSRYYLAQHTQSRMDLIVSIKF